MSAWPEFQQIAVTSVRDQPYLYGLDIRGRVWRYQHGVGWVSLREKAVDTESKPTSPPTPAEFVLTEDDLAVIREEADEAKGA